MEDFSVAISVYKKDNPIFFDRALESITDLQTVKPNEIVLVVDGPVSKEIDSVIFKYVSKYSFFNIIRLEKNEGLGYALKIATENCKNELIARMDSDDIAVSDRFEQQLSFFETNPNTDIVGGNISEFIGIEDNIVSHRVLPTADNDLKQYIKKRCPFNHVTVMYKRQAIINAGGYQDWFWNEDYYLWIRMYLKGAIFANTGTILVNVRIGKNMYARRGGKEYFDSEIRLQKYMHEHNMIGHCRYLINYVKRFIVQRILPNSIRGWVFRHIARSK